jgi:hypothetical protein
MPRAYKLIGLPIRIDFENDMFFIENNSYPFSEAKEYLLKHHDNLLTKWRLKVLWNSEGKARVLYCWDSIIAEAVKKQILPYNPTSQQHEPINFTNHFILTGEKF